MTFSEVPHAASQPEAAASMQMQWLGCSSRAGRLGENIAHNQLLVVIAVCQRLDAICQLGGHLLDSHRDLGRHLLAHAHHTPQQTHRFVPEVVTHLL